MEGLKFTEENEFGCRVRVNPFNNLENLHEILRTIINFDDPRDLKVKNILELFDAGMLIAQSSGKCFGHRPSKNAPYKWISYGEFYSLYTNCAKGLSTLGIEFGENVNFATYSKMSHETFAVVFAAFRRRNAVIPLYDTLGMSAIEHIISEASPAVVFCDNEKRALSLLAISNFKASYILIPFTPSEELKSKTGSVTLLTIEELAKLGADVIGDDYVIPTLDDLAYILYTSGSTGIPKGVKLCHRQLVFNVTTLIRTLGTESLAINVKNLVYFSYLPYQHSFESLVLLFVLTIGSPIGISQGNMMLLVSDLTALQPTMMIAVPRVLERFKSKILETIDKGNPITRWIFNWAFNRRKEQLISKNDLPHSMFYNFLFRKIHASFGGKLRYLIVGGASMSLEIEIFSRVLFGVDLMQGYGLTETTAATMVQSIGNRGLMEAGAPMYGIEIKLVDAPAYNYFSANGEGELCVRGPNVSPGYYKRPDADKEAFTEDGFFCSGDIARLNENGSFTIIDRCKNIFKLSQGEYIMPEKIENVYLKHPLVKQIMIYGESNQDHCVAVVIVDKEELVKYSSDLNVSADCLHEDKVVKNKLTSELIAMGKSAGLFGFEQVKGVVLDYNEFTISNDLLTPTMKLKRPNIKKLYINSLRDLYNSTN